MEMPAEWTGRIVGQMHRYRIRQSELAAQAGWTRVYVSTLLNGHRTTADAEKRLSEAMEALIASKEGANMSESKIVLSGRFEVFPDGRVNRVSGPRTVPAKISYVGRNLQYAVVHYMDGHGKEKHAYVHRLVASAFLPNPDHLPQVSHKDGNTRNNRVENLQWVTNRQNCRHAYDTGLVNPMATARPCTYCGAFTKTKNGICPVCRKTLGRDARRIDKAAELRDRFGALEVEKMPARMKLYVQSRANGLSVQAIAAKYGVSRQAVSYLLLMAEENYQRGERNHGEDGEGRLSGGEAG